MIASISFFFYDSAALNKKIVTYFLNIFQVTECQHLKNKIIFNQILFKAKVTDFSCFFMGYIVFNS